ncbi:hypothetical protein BwSG20_78070 [Bradyrhizobium ottawaense]|nr:hypothetical protein BwSG20_78070 [Bradyrhizobium ottawaense]
MAANWRFRRLVELALKLNENDAQLPASNAAATAVARGSARMNGNYRAGPADSHRSMGGIYA